MPAVKSIPIKDAEEKVVAYRFEPSNSFTADLNKNYVAMQDEKGRTVRANKKLARSGHYADKGYESAEKSRK